MFSWLSLLGVLLLNGCGGGHPIVLGQNPSGDTQSIASLGPLQDALPVTIQGVMVEKCPAAGCWFILRDSSGAIKVDTKMAGFVVVQVPLQTRLTVTGKIKRDEESQILEAAGLRYSF